MPFIPCEMQNDAAFVGKKLTGFFVFCLFTFVLLCFSEIPVLYNPVLVDLAICTKVLKKIWCKVVHKYNLTIFFDFFDVLKNI